MLVLIHSAASQLQLMNTTIESVIMYIPNNSTVYDVNT